MEFFISAFVVVIVAVIIIVSLFVTAKRHRDAYMRRTSDSFTVRGGRGAILSVCLALFAPLFMSLLFAFLQAESGSAHLRAGPAYFIIASVCLIAAVLLTVDYMNHMLAVKGDKLTYYDWLGRGHDFMLCDVERVATGKGRLVLFDADDMRLAVVDKNMIGADELLSYLKERGIAKHHTLDK